MLIIINRIIYTYGNELDFNNEIYMRRNNAYSKYNSDIHHILVYIKPKYKTYNIY